MEQWPISEGSYPFSHIIVAPNMINLETLSYKTHIGKARQYSLMGLPIRPGTLLGLTYVSNNTKNILEGIRIDVGSGDIVHNR